jgi:hypothetical protein
MYNLINIHFYTYYFQALTELANKSIVDPLAEPVVPVAGNNDKDIYIYMYMIISIYIYGYIYCVYTCISVYICIYIYVYIYIYIFICVLIDSVEQKYAISIIILSIQTIVTTILQYFYFNTFTHSISIFMHM